MQKNLKLAASIMALVASLFAGVWAMDARYAKAEDLKVQIGEIKQLYLASERRALQREQFDLLSMQQRRPLTPLEKQRLEIITDEIRQVEFQLKALRR